MSQLVAGSMNAVSSLSGRRCRSSAGHGLCWLAGGRTEQSRNGTVPPEGAAFENSHATPWPSRPPDLYQHVAPIEVPIHEDTGDSTIRHGSEFGAPPSAGEHRRGEAPCSRMPCRCWSKRNARDPPGREPSPPARPCRTRCRQSSKSCFRLHGCSQRIPSRKFGRTARRPALPGPDISPQRCGGLRQVDRTGNGPPASRCASRVAVILCSLCARRACTPQAATSIPRYAIILDGPGRASLPPKAE